GVGSALLVTSIALIVADDLSGPSSRRCDAFSSVCSDGSGRTSLWAGGMAAFAVGAPMLGAGIATYVVGGYQMSKGNRLALSGFAVAPTLGPGGVGGGTVAASFRF